MSKRYLIAFGLLLPVSACAPSGEEKQAPAPATAQTKAGDAAGIPPSPSQGPVSIPIDTTSRATTRLTSAGRPESATPAPVDADAIFKQAELAIKNRDTDGALKKVEETLAVNPTHRGALLARMALLQDQAQAAEQPSQAQQRNELFLKSAAAARQFRAANPDLNPKEKGLVAVAFYNEACAYALAKDTDKAMSSLNEAIDAGFPELNLLYTDPDLASIRDTSAFRDLQQRTAQLAKIKLGAWAKKLLAEQKPFEFKFRRPDVRSAKLVPLSDFKGKVVVVDLWATWCPPCRAEVPELVKLHKAYRERGLEVVGLNFEGTPFKEAKATVKDFAKQHAISYTVLLGDDKTKSQVPNFVGFPTLLFFDRAGRMRLMRTGYHPYPLLEAIATTLLEEPGTTVASKS